MVQHPGAALKTCEAESPTSAQRNETGSESRLACCPNFFSNAVTKSEGVIPSLDWDLTDFTNVVVMSSRASASATCSLGLCTAVWKGISFWVFYIA